jgi:hypothetical protein
MSRPLGRGAKGKREAVAMLTGEKLRGSRAAGPPMISGTGRSGSGAGRSTLGR